MGSHPSERLIIIQINNLFGWIENIYVLSEGADDDFSPWGRLFDGNARRYGDEERRVKGNPSGERYVRFYAADKGLCGWREIFLFPRDDPVHPFFKETIQGKDIELALVFFRKGIIVENRNTEAKGHKFLDGVIVIES
jgi:hypothetical protein